MKLPRIAAATALAIALAAPAAAQRAPAPQGWSAEGSLAAGDRQDGEGYRYDDHRLRLVAGQRYRITAESDDFDTVIQLFRPGQAEPLAEDDDSGEGLNSRLYYTPDRTGDHVLRVRGFSTESEGAYRLRADVPPPLPAPIATGPAVETTTWMVYRGRLDEGDAEIGGVRVDDYLVTLDAGEEILVRLDSADFDALVHVLSADERDGDPLATDDDSGGDLNSLLRFTADEAGDYVVRVTSYGGGEDGESAAHGAYRLRIGR